MFILGLHYVTETDILQGRRTIDVRKTRGNGRYNILH